MQLLLSLARLDERFERGELSPEAYRFQRESGKRRLVALGQLSPGSAANGE